MPGHKGASSLGFEQLDITEIDGADSLYGASGIIAESEREASALFGCATYYSTEGSSQCIKAMMHLVVLCARKRGKKPLVWALRNAHKAFHSAIGLLDIDIEWICPSKMDNYLSCKMGAEELSELFERADKKPTALYVTTPDYLGNTLDVGAIADVCHKNGVLLVVDNAHGAYLKFLPESKHPMDLGADICCDSAHKTLPVLTGGAYLHLSDELLRESSCDPRRSMELFGSTSPSYLILQSLDMANVYLENYGAALAKFILTVDKLKAALLDNGYVLYGNEELKITICAKEYGYYGYELADTLKNEGVICEFADRDFVVLMLTPELEKDLPALEKALLSIPKKKKIVEKAPSFKMAHRSISVREAMLSPFESLPISGCLGRVASLSSVGCPPAVPIVVSGEIIDEEAIKCFEYYGIDKCNVVCK